MAKFLAKLAAFAARNPEQSSGYVFKAALLIVVILTVISMAGMEMIGSFSDSDDYINNEFQIKDQTLYKKIEKVYEQFENEMQKQMNEREAEIIAENTVTTEVEKVDEDGNIYTVTESVCTAHVSKQFTPINFSYVLSYINHKHPVKDGEKYDFDEKEIKGFFEEIAPFKEVEENKYYTLFTDLQSPETVAGMYFQEDDDKQMYLLSYDLYLDFLDFVDDGSADSDMSNGVPADGKHYTNLPTDEAAAVLGNCPDGIGKKVIEYALSKLGYPYSQAKRDSGDYYDCSSLCYYAYKSAGIGITYGGANTAAALAQYCYTNNQTISVEQLQPGDLIFYRCSGGNGRFMEIDHVGIYAGNGKIIDASSSKGYVVYRNLYWKDKIVLCGRPR